MVPLVPQSIHQLLLILQASHESSRFCMEAFLLFTFTLVHWQTTPETRQPESNIFCHFVRIKTYLLQYNVFNMQTWVVVLSLIEISSFGLFRIVNSGVFSQSKNCKFKIQLYFIASWGLLWGFQTPNFTHVFEPRTVLHGHKNQHFVFK